MRKSILFKLIICSLLFCLTENFAQEIKTTEIHFQKDEFWWGGVVANGSQMPYITPLKEYNLALQNSNNQVVPLFFSLSFIIL